MAGGSHHPALHSRVAACVPICSRTRPYKVVRLCSVRQGLLQLFHQGHDLQITQPHDEKGVRLRVVRVTRRGPQYTQGARRDNDRVVGRKVGCNVPPSAPCDTGTGLSGGVGIVRGVGPVQQLQRKGSLKDKHEREFAAWQLELSAPRQLVPYAAGQPTSGRGNAHLLKE